MISLDDLIVELRWLLAKFLGKKKRNWCVPSHRPLALQLLTGSCFCHWRLNFRMLSSAAIFRM
jgi:hypothetical protein